MSGIKCLKTIFFLNINVKLLAGSNPGDGATKKNNLDDGPDCFFYFI